MRMKQPADLIGTYVFDREDLAASSVEPADAPPPKIPPLDLPSAGGGPGGPWAADADGAGAGDRAVAETLRADAPAEVGVLQSLFACGAYPCAAPLAERSLTPAGGVARGVGVRGRRKVGGWCVCLGKLMRATVRL